MDPGVPGNGAGGGEAGRSGWPGEAAVPAPELATLTGLDSQRLQDSVSWLRSAALSSARVPEAQGGVLGGTRDAASTQVLLAARQALSLARHTPAPSGEPQTTARAPRRVGRAAATSGDEALLNDDATATRSGLPLHSYERRDPRIGSAYQARVPERLVGEALLLGAPSGPSDAAQPRLSDAHLTPRMVELMGTRVWPPPGQDAPDSLLGLGPFVATGTEQPLTRHAVRRPPPLLVPPPWPGSREGAAARGTRAALAGAASLEVMGRVGETAAAGLGMHRIGSADGWDWSLTEVATFAAAYERYGRNFASIAAAVRTKSVRRCVGFYYNVWKTMLIPEAVAYYDAMAAERAEASGAVNSENLAPVPPLNAHSAGAPLLGRAYPLGVPPYPPAQGQGQTHTRRGGGDNAPGGYTGGGGLGAGRRGFPAAAPAAWHAYPPLLPASAPCGGLGYRQGTVSASPLLVPGLQNRVSPAVFGTADPRYLNHTPVAQHPAPQAQQKRLQSHGRVALGGFGSIALAQAGGLGQPDMNAAFAHSAPPARPPASFVAPDPAPAPAAPNPAVAKTTKKKQSKPGWVLVPMAAEQEAGAAQPGSQEPKELGVGKRQKKRASKFSDSDPRGQWVLKKRKMTRPAPFPVFYDTPCAGSGGEGDGAGPVASTFLRVGSQDPDDATRALTKSINERQLVDPKLATELLALDKQRHHSAVVCSKAADLAHEGRVELVATVAAADVVAHAVAKAADPEHDLNGVGHAHATLVNPRTGRIYPAVPGTIQARPKEQSGGVGGKFSAEVTRLLAAAFELNPFPTKATKIILAAQTGLTPEQTRVWFMNARSRGVRL